MIAVTASVFIGLILGYACAVLRQQAHRRHLSVELATADRRMDTLDALLLTTGVRPVDRRPN